MVHRDFMELDMITNKHDRENSCQSFKFQITRPCNSLRAEVAAISELNLTNPYPFDSPVLWSHITLTTQKH
jgi:hypothetical protein